MRRGVGIRGLQQSRIRQTQFQSEATRLQESHLASLEESLSFFKQKLAQYAEKYKKQINKNPELRYRFREMCREIGVDPLKSSKGFWAELLGVGDFYYELAVQIVEICYHSRAENGGLMTLSLVHEKVRQRRERYRSVEESSGSKKKSQISVADIQQAIQKLHTLGAGFTLQTIGQETYVLSVPYELNQDHSYILSLVQNTDTERGYTVSDLESLIRKSEGDDEETQRASQRNPPTTTRPWSRTRIHKTLEFLLQQGIVWIDQPSVSATYYFVSLQGDLFSLEE